MSFSNWIEIAVGAFALAAGLLLLLWFRRKFKRLDGVEGIVMERGRPVRRMEPDWQKELQRLEKLINRTAPKQ